MTTQKKIGKRRTAQREAISEALSAAGRPLTVQELHTAAQAQLGNLGIATVYRTLKLLLEGGEISTVALPDDELRYELANLGHHHHFHCRVCDQVFDLPNCPVALPEGTVFPSGFRVESHEITLYGTCRDCPHAA